MDFSQAIQLHTRKNGYVTDETLVSPDLRSFLDSEGITNLILQICAKYGIPQETGSDVIQLVVWYVSKQVSEQEFVNLVSLAPVQQKFLPLFMQELQEKLWDPYDTALGQAHIPYKLLTKLTAESPEKIQQWLNALVQQYPEQPEEDIDALFAEEQPKPQDFSLGDQIKIFAGQTAAQSLGQPQQIKTTVPDTSFTPVQPQVAKPIEITINQPQTIQPAQPVQTTKPIEQPASQVRLEISSSPNAPQATEPMQPTPKLQPEPQTFSLPSIRFQPLLEKQEGVMPKQVTPSAVLQEALGTKESTQEPAATQPNAPESEKPAASEQTKPQQETGKVIDLTSWNVTS